MQDFGSTFHHQVLYWENILSSKQVLLSEVTFRIYGFAQNKNIMPNWIQLIKQQYSQNSGDSCFQIMIERNQYLINYTNIVLILHTTIVIKAIIFLLPKPYHENSKQGFPESSFSWPSNLRQDAKGISVLTNVLEDSIVTKGLPGQYMLLPRFPVISHPNPLSLHSTLNPLCRWP